MTPTPTRPPPAVAAAPPPNLPFNRAVPEFPELLAGLADAYLSSASKQLQTMPVQQIIISHGGLLLWTSSTQRQGRRFYV